MRVLFMGSPAFAVPSLQALAGGRQEVIGVFTQPDRPRGRGGRLRACPVKERAGELCLPVYSGQLRDPACQQVLRRLRPDVIVVVAFGQVLPPEVLTIPGAGCLNLHASLLPRYRGAAPIHWCVINGERETGVTTMFMAERLDSGDVILQRALPLRPGMTRGEVEAVLAPLGADLLLETLDLAARGRLPRRPQDEKLATWAPAIRPQDEAIDWSRPANATVRLVLGLNPSPGAYTTDNGQRLKVWRAEVWSPPPGGLEGMPPNQGREPAQAAPGTVVAMVGDRGFVVQAGGSGAVLVTEVQPAGRRALPAAEYVRGRRLRVGDRLAS